ncbi:MAG: ARPP-1 family domain-containing protein [Thermoplasmata archaeon]
MTVFPLDTSSRGHPYVLLSDALESGQVEITEVSEGGAVPVVRVTNRDSKPVLMIDGEELVGCKQNRMLNSTILVPARSTIDVPVSCIERSRWNYTSGRFRNGVMPPTTLLGMKAKQVASELRARGAHDSDQSAGEWNAYRTIRVRWPFINALSFLPLDGQVMIARCPLALRNLMTDTEQKALSRYQRFGRMPRDLAEA